MTAACSHADQVVYKCGSAWALVGFKLYGREGAGCGRGGGGGLQEWAQGILHEHEGWCLEQTSFCTPKFLPGGLVPLLQGDL